MSAAARAANNRANSSLC